jgi:plasmid stabilization system protein ParE
MAAISLELLEEAIAEARAAREWYEERSPSAAEAFMAELDHALEQIAEFPEAGALYLRNTRRRLLRRFPFSVVYRKERRKIIVIAVVHSRRRPGYWQDRVGKPRM